MVRVTPRASEDAVTGRHEGPDGACALAVRVRAAPADGKANKAVVAVLAKALGVPKSRLSIVSGTKDRLKSVLVRAEEAEAEAAIRALVARLPEG